MNSFKTSLVIGLLGTSILAGCKKNTLNAESLSANSFDTVMTVKSRKVGDADVQAALKILSLDDKSGPFEWDKMTVEGSRVIFTGFKNDGGTFQSSNLTLTGLHTEENSASFDKLEISGLSTGFEVELSKDKAEDQPFDRLSFDILADKLVLANPDKTAASQYIASLTKSDDMTSLMPLGFDGSVTKDMSISMNGQNIANADYSALAKAKDGTYYSYTENMDLNMTEFIGDMMKDSGAPLPEISLSMKMDKIKMTGISEEYIKNMQEIYKGNFFMSGTSMSEMTYDKMVVENTQMDVMGAIADIPLMYGTGEKTGDVFKQKQTIEESTLTFKVPDDPMAAKVFTDLGIQKMTFTSYFESTTDFANDTSTIDKGVMDFKDQFSLNFEMGTSGMLAFQNRMAELGMDGIMADPKAIENLPMYDVTNLKLSLTDQSLMDRVWKVAAETQQMDDPDMLKNQAKGLLMMASMGAQSPVQKEMMGDATKALSTFIDQNGTLTVEMKPEKGFSFAEMEKPGADIDEMLGKLGLRFTHTAPGTTK